MVELREVRITPPETDSDIDEMVVVRTESAADAYPREGGPTPELVRSELSNDEPWIAEKITNGEFEALCAKKGDGIVGICIWSEKDEFRTKLEYLYVATKHQKQGIGKKLLDTVLDIIGSDKEIELTTQDFQKLYESRGFVRTGEYVTDAITSEEVMIRPASSDSIKLR